MSDFIKKYFNTVFVVVCLLVFIVICLRAFFIPFAHDEASTFFFYIQSNNYLPYKAHVYTNNHVLNSALANICYHLAGSHRFVLRIPNILAFIVLCFGVFKFFRYLNKISSKIILTCFFILTFNFLDFFELCRGYGLSMAFMVLGLAYLQDYFSDRKLKQLVLFSVWWQLALSANLTLVVVSVIVLFFIYLFQLREKLFFNPRNLILQLINIFILIFWIKFSFFYKSKGMLDSGWGEDYWEVSFKSLILFIFGSTALWIQVLVIVLFSLMLAYGIFCFFRKPVSPDSVFKPQFFYLIILSALIIAFYLQKKWLGVNYPEDRTGLCFYIFFALGLSFFFEAAHKYFSVMFALPFLAGSITYFCISFNLSSFTHYFYHVIPKEIYTYLENEFKRDQQLFTIGGQPNREMNYAFLNYRAGGLLNPMDNPREMHMNCDYSFALMCEKPFYRFFYDEVAYDTRWHRVLLKRKQKIKRNEIESLTRGPGSYKGNDEFFEFLRFKDSALTSRNCIEADIELSFKNVPKPFTAFVVLQVTDENENNVSYKRVLLNWIADDLNGSTRRFKITSDPLPEKFKNAIVYIWNIDKAYCEFEMKKLKIFELRAPGINVVIPKNYYPYVKKIIKEEIL